MTDAAQESVRNAFATEWLSGEVRIRRIGERYFLDVQIDTGGGASSRRQFEVSERDADQMREFYD